MSEGGNLRNGANAGLCYLNCGNRLDRANWNYLSANFWNKNTTLQFALISSTKSWPYL
nr:MAG TPA: hypothetical protein [Bacteriophage sp.]